MATISEQLRAGRARIEDQVNWYKGGWAYQAHDLFPENDQEFLEIGHVCAVTALAQASVESGDLQLTYTNTIEHECDEIGDPYCNFAADGVCTTPDEIEGTYPLSSVLDGVRWIALQYLDMAADQLYDHEPTTVNDSKQYTHADVLKVYDRAILLAEEDEAEATS